MSKKRKLGIAILAWFMFNWALAYKDGVFHRGYEMYKLSKGENFMFSIQEIWNYAMFGELPEVKVQPVDECFTSPSGESLLYGRCDECGAPCTPLGCLANPLHSVAQD